MDEVGAKFPWDHPTTDKGVLFLDEIGDLGFDEQTMCLRVIEGQALPAGGIGQGGVGCGPSAAL